MERGRLSSLFTCFLSSIFAICLLFVFSKKYNLRKNGFIRLFPPHVVDPSSEHDLVYNSYYIAGLATSHIYLGNLTANGLILITDYSLSKFDTLRLKFRNANKMKWNLRAYIDSPNIYLADGQSPVIFYCRLPELELNQQKTNNTHFSLIAPINQSSFICREYDSLLDQNILCKVTSSPILVKKGNGILEKQIDGVFCTDGMLLHDDSLNLLDYVYYYRNQLICMDTDLRVLCKTHTIDTITTAKIKVFQSLTYSTLASPPHYTNKKSCAWGGYIFVNSALRANNEDYESFGQSSVIDVYSEKNGRYMFSFYITRFGQQTLRDFRVCNKKLVALYDHQILSFRLFY